MSDTPRTDEFSGYINRDGNLNRDDRYPGAHQFILASFSRQLESELAAMTAELIRCEKDLDSKKKECDTLRAENIGLQAGQLLLCSNLKSVRAALSQTVANTSTNTDAA